MKFVLDASVVITWLLPDEADDRADRLLGDLTAHTVTAPAIWPLEVINALRSAQLRRRITADDAGVMVGAMGKLHVQLDIPDDRQLLTIFELTRKHALSAYDAAYLELAVRLQLPLATFDRRLGEVAQLESVSFTFPSSA